MTGLLDLPSELIPFIAHYLHDKDFFNLRLTHRYLQHSTISHFGRNYFRKRGYLITTPSLHTLTSISAHLELRKHVQHVWFNPDMYTFVTPECAPNPQYPYSVIYGTRSDDENRKYDNYQDCVHDHKHILHSSKLEDALRGVFENLPNLDSVGMRRSEDHRPWGWRQLLDAIGEDPRKLGNIPSGPMSSLSGPTHLFMAIVNALASTNVKLRRLYTDAVEIDNILPDLLSQDKLNAALSTLWYLEINASKAQLTQKARHGYNPDESEWGDGLLRLLKATPQLRELGLQIFRDLRQSYMVAPAPQLYANQPGSSWQCSYPYLTFEKLAHNVELSWLTRVKLEKLITSPDTLIKFLRPARRRLQSLKLRDIRLVSSDGDRRPWQRVFEALRDKCRQLSYVLFYHLMHSEGVISFAPPPAPSPPPAVQPFFPYFAAPAIPDPPIEGSRESSEHFMKYEHIALEARGREAVEEWLEIVVEKHWYQGRVFTYAMDEGLWHTDTSDEE